MLHVTLNTKHMNADVDVTKAKEEAGYNTRGNFVPSADFVSCLLTGVMAALPAFLEAFMNCLGGGGGGGSGYQPGQRTRCDGQVASPENPDGK